MDDNDIKKEPEAVVKKETEVVVKKEPEVVVKQEEEEKEGLIKRFGRA